MTEALRQAIVRGCTDGPSNPEHAADAIMFQIGPWIESWQKALQMLQERHYPRQIGSRTELCRQRGSYRPCDGLGDPACGEECLTTITICNGCGTQDQCGYTDIMVVLAGLVMTVSAADLVDPDE